MKAHNKALTNRCTRHAYACWWPRCYKRLKMKYTFIFILFIVVGCGNEIIGPNYKAQLFHANLVALNKIEINYENDGYHALKLNIEKDQSLVSYSAKKGICSAELVLSNQELNFHNVNNKIGPIKLEGTDLKIIQGKSYVRKNGSILLGTFQNTKDEKIEITINLVKYN